MHERAIIILRAQERKRRACGIYFPSRGFRYQPRAAGRSGEAASDCTNVQSLYYVRRKGSAAHAAFTFQAVAPGIIPAQRGEAEKPLRIARTCNHYTTVYPPKKVFITVSIFNTVFTNINLRLMQHVYNSVIVFFTVTAVRGSERQDKQGPV